MSKMAEVAKILGVELDEVFDVEDGFRGEMDKTIVCRLTEKGLQTCVRVISCRGDITENWVGDGMLLSGLLCDNDRFTIVKKPWMPKDGDEYYTYFGADFRVGMSHWSGFPDEFAKYKCGMAFRTRGEAIAERPRVYKEVTGKEWSKT
jgi:hypothetical protein